MTAILTAILTARDRQKYRKPVLVKISPDISFLHLDEILKIAEKMGVDGIVAVNTTTLRHNLTIDKEKITRLGNGGMSGKPLTWKALEVVNYIRQHTKGRMPVIGAGGVMTPFHSSPFAKYADRALGG